MLETSLEKNGAGRSIVVDKNGVIIAGNKTAQVAHEIGIDDIQVVQTSGDKLVVVQRVDLDMEDPEDRRARNLAFADNRVGEVDLSWNPDKMAAFVQTADYADYMKPDELKKILEASGAGQGGGGDSGDDVYTSKITAPIYTPKGEKPEPGSLYDDTKTKALLGNIQKAKLPDDVKAFLIVAAQRHTVIDFGAVAEYYAHADRELQRLMEDSALVIIDFKRAIELGYVALSELVMQRYGKEH